ncbi:MAG: CoA transferase [Betaproteobacteria bacterium]|nr:CoA transferase [Betaproteobacteria bacterium]
MTPSKAAVLAGIKVLDMSRILAGPWCAMMLGDLGADVIKVENPDGGDDTRHLGTAITGGERTYYLCVNRNKRSIAIDFRTAEGQAIIRQLASQSDVFIENYKLGDLERYGLDYESLRALNPRLIYLSISGYGREGPHAARLGYDFILQGESGLMSVTGEPDGPPMKVGAPFVDITTGTYASQAVLAALLARERTGEGQLIDIALFDCALANLSIIASNALLLGTVPKRFGNTHVDISPYETFRCSDGDIIITVANDAQFQRMCHAMGRPDIAADPRFQKNDGRLKHKAALRELLNSCLATRTRQEWYEALRDVEVAAGSVRNVSEAIAVAADGGRDMVVEVPHPTAGSVKLIGSPLKLRGTPVVAPMAPPTLGQHTDEILRDSLGMDAERIAQLRALGAVA